MDNPWVTMFDHGWVFSVLKPGSPPRYPPLILLHGLSGDETSLRALSAQIDRSRWIIAVRGNLTAPDNGFAWAPPRSRKQSDFSPSLQAFAAEWESIRSLLDLSASSIDLMGFSQGAAFASLLLLTAPHLIRRTALISGFIPQLEADTFPDLTGHPILISHGTEDELVPFEEALKSADLLTSFGAEVTFCQSNTRHKIGAYCLNLLETFFD